MILIDANLLLYAYDATSPEHRPARTWIEAVFSGSTPVLLPWPTIMAFLRIATNPRALASPMTRSEATGIVGDWLDRRQVTTPTAGERHREILSGLIQNSQASGALMMDAHLAAIAIEHGAALYSADHDFSRFPGLDWRNPLQ